MLMQVPLIELYVDIGDVRCLQCQRHGICNRGELSGKKHYDLAPIGEPAALRPRLPCIWVSKVGIEIRGVEQGERASHATGHLVRLRPMVRAGMTVSRASYIPVTCSRNLQGYATKLRWFEQNLLAVGSHSVQPRHRTGSCKTRESSAVSQLRIGALGLDRWTEKLLQMIP